MTEQIFNIDGLSCGGCVNHVTEAFTGLPEVTEVNVELVPNGTSVVTVNAGRELGAAEVQAALSDEGNYTLRS